MNSSSLPSYNYGHVPASSTARMEIQTRPEPQGYTADDTASYRGSSRPAGTSSSSLQAYQTKTYEPFEQPSHVHQPHHWAAENPVRGHERQPTQCPHCLQGKTYTRLPHDPTDSVFCTSCRQPYHFCYVHGLAQPGMGLVKQDPGLRQCQCQTHQDFLGDRQWSSCFQT